MFRYAGVAEWQTHLTQNQAGNTVWVQVPPPAPTLGGKTFVLPPIFIFMNLYTIRLSVKCWGIHPTSLLWHQS